MSRIGTAFRKCNFSRPCRRVTTRPASSSNLRCFMTPKRVIGSRPSRALKVCPSSSNNLSSSFLRVGSASALNTSSMPATIRDHLVTCQVALHSRARVSTAAQRKAGLPFTSLQDRRHAALTGEPPIRPRRDNTAPYWDGCCSPLSGLYTREETDRPIESLALTPETPVRRHEFARLLRGQRVAPVSGRACCHVVEALPLVARRQTYVSFGFASIAPLPTVLSRRCGPDRPWIYDAR